MNTVKALSLIIFLSLSSSALAQTQKQLNDDAEIRLKAVEIELTKTYNKILEEYKSDPEFIKNIKESQELWGKLLVADMKMKFPDRSKREYGSSYSMCFAEYKYELVNERAKKLTTWLKGTKEGDVCAGSVKFKN